MRYFILLAVLLAIASCCVKRADVIAKGLEWVKDKVPYSQTSTHEGYRTDCSGFASCCWRLSKPGLTTRDFVPNKVCVETTKDKLEAGDLILHPDHHVVVFHEWANAQKTIYWLMEEEGTAYGTVRRQTTYPYGSATGFFPCKVKNACSEE